MPFSSLTKQSSSVFFKKNKSNAGITIQLRDSTPFNACAESFADLLKKGADFEAATEKVIFDVKTPCFDFVLNINGIAPTAVAAIKYIFACDNDKIGLRGSFRGGYTPSLFFQLLGALVVVRTSARKEKKRQKEQEQPEPEKEQKERLEDEDDEDEDNVNIEDEVNSEDDEDDEEDDRFQDFGVGDMEEKENGEENNEDEEDGTVTNFDCAKRLVDFLNEAHPIQWMCSYQQNTRSREINPVCYFSWGHSSHLFVYSLYIQEKKCVDCLATLIEGHKCNALTCVSIIYILYSTLVPFPLTIFSIRSAAAKRLFRARRHFTHSSAGQEEPELKRYLQVTLQIA